ncbi:hypothetical protein ABMA28_011455 [Loxostege sticticalis]|uniref:CCHC-type domain-containing protein n=2 Tax=Loxostege sticticalis TaxID=481309 RepID=A0ABD0S932_LOXSC
MGGRDNNRRNSRQLDFEDAEGSGSGRSANQFTLGYSEEMVPKFSGQDKTYSSSRWAQEVEENAEIFGWSPLQQLIVGRRALIGTAALWLRSEKPFRSWEDLKTALIKEFPDSIDIKTIHELMTARKKKHNESCLDYLLTMKELGKRGKMPDYVAIKYIIDGIQDVETNKIVLYGAKTYSELKEKMQIYETVKAKMSVARKPQYSSNSATAHNAPPRKCYSCGESQHLSSQCPHKERGVKCFRCNDFGHKSTECQKSKPENHQQHPYGDNFRVECSSWRDESQRRQTDQKRTMFAETPEQRRRNVVMTEIDDECTREHNELLTDTMSTVTVTPNVTKLQNVNKSTTAEKIIEFTENFGFTTAALIDTGSEVNIMTNDVHKQIGSPKYDDGKCFSLSGLGQFQINPLGKVTLDIKIDGDIYNIVVFYVVNKSCLPYDAIIGREFLTRVLLVMKDGCVRLLAKDDEWMNQFNVFTCDVAGYVGNNDFKEKLTDLVENYQPKQVKESPIELKIVLKDDIPVAQRPRRLSLHEQQVVEQQVDEWLNDNIIRVSHSEYASPLVLSKEDVELLDFILEEEKNCFMLERDDLRKSAKEYILKIQEENQRSYNKKRKESTKYKVGDFVAIKRTQFGGCLKLKPKYLGPYEVKNVKPNDRYDVEKVDHSAEGPCRTSSCADYMKPWPAGKQNDE